MYMIYRYCQFENEKEGCKKIRKYLERLNMERQRRRKKEIVITKPTIPLCVTNSSSAHWNPWTYQVDKECQGGQIVQSHSFRPVVCEEGQMEREKAGEKRGCCRPHRARRRLHIQKTSFQFKSMQNADLLEVIS